MFGEHDGYIPVGDKITFGDELAFHQRGLYVWGLAHITNGGSGGMMSTARLELPCPQVSQAKFLEGKVM